MRRYCQKVFSAAPEVMTRRRTLRRLDATEAPKLEIDQMVDSWKDWRRIERLENKARSSLPPADVEPASSHEQVGKAEGGELDKRVRLHFHSRRRRLADPDGVSCKAAIDGLVQGGILVDDSAKYVKEVSFSQEISETEETVIDICVGLARSLDDAINAMK